MTSQHWFLSVKRGSNGELLGQLSSLRQGYGTAEQKDCDCQHPEDNNQKMKKVSPQHALVLACSGFSLLAFLSSKNKVTIKRLLLSTPGYWLMEPSFLSARDHRHRLSGLFVHKWGHVLGCISCTAFQIVETAVCPISLLVSILFPAYCNLLPCMSFPAHWSGFLYSGKKIECRLFSDWTVA